MEQPVREPCIHCGEPAALVAKICSHCRGSLLVDLVLEQPVTDSRVRYQVARGVSALGRELGSFLDVQRALGSADRVVLRHVTRQGARATQEILSADGIRSFERAAVARGSVASRTVLLALAGALALALVAVGWLLFRTRPESFGGTDPSTALTTRQIAERAGPSTVSLTCPESVGTGFFVTDELLLTNAHVLCKWGDALEVHFSDGRELSGTVVSRDDDLDVASVRVVGAKAPPLLLGDAARLSPGDKVVVIGTPLGMEYTVHEGIVSYAGRPMYGTAYLQIDANINPGNSGGPLLDAEGHVVGIVSMQIQDANGLGFALPINYTFTGGRAFVPVPAAASPEWNAIVAAAEEQERKDLEMFGVAFQRTALVQAIVRPGQSVVAVVMRRSPWLPDPEEAAAKVMRNGEVVCEGTAFVSTWRPAEATPVAEETPQIRWLRKRQLLKDLFVGGALFRGSDCPSSALLAGAELWLEGGDAERNHVRIEAFTEGAR